MYFFIDNTKTDETAFFISTSGTDWRKESFESDGEGALEKAFDRILKKEGLNYDEVKGVAVRVGAGRFTSTRLAVTFANTLALALRIPVLAVMDESPEGLVEKLKQTPVGQYAQASYSGEPRLGGKEK
jgi:hypothetical protein